MNRDQLLAVLYDLALTIGHEVRLDALLTKVLQRLMFHTGSPAGLALHHPEGAATDYATLLKAIGDHALQQRAGERIAIPAGLLGKNIAPLDKAELLASLTGHDRYRFCLRLPVEQRYTILLLGLAPLSDNIPYDHVFPPVLANLSRAIQLCQDSERLAEAKEKEHRAMQAQLTRSQIFSRALLNAIPVAAFYKDTHGRYLGANPKFCELLAVKEEDIVGHTADELWPKDLAAFYQHSDRQILESRRPLNLEHAYRNPEGEERLALYAKNVFYDEKHEVAGLIGTFIDITERRDAEARLKQSLIQTINALSSAMAHRDMSTASHEKRVSDLAVAIGREMGLDDQRLEGLGLAAMVHDIGLIQIPSEILTRPRRLTVEEFDLLKLHSEAGYEILKDIDLPWPIARIILQHHENHDGSGYPNGVRGDDILLEAQIIHVADSMEAMLSHRPFRRHLEFNQAINELKRCRGVWYAPEPVDACLKLFLEKGYQLPDHVKKSLQAATL
ncbi:HD domain-containing phosphohydrolase [uncultured Aquitalea sp.]|uniref:HD-GYP domain-containing protein n=1 Tax=uncultured Aquitalea sp. TaxID=540272 RepID=UPI0025D06F08|nr:HD domain-containing phosphohydrolase [uncultured Aquitalea sp.]